MNDEINYEKEIEAEIKKLTSTSNEMQSVKRKVLDKLSTSIDKMTLDIDRESPKTIEAKGSIINAFVALAADLEKQQRDTLKFKTRYQIDKDTQEDISEVIVGILNKLTANSNSVKPNITDNISTIDSNVDDRIKKENIQILDEELTTEKKSQKPEDIINNFNLTGGE